MPFIEERIKKLNTELIKMGAMCEECISAAIDGFLEDNSGLLDKTAVIEQEINKQERLIDTHCMKTLRKFHPVAKDLRVVSAAQKMVSDMERIGDQSFEIATLAKTVKNSKMIGKTHIKEMAIATISMVAKSVESFVKSDIEIANQVIADDDIVDAGFNRVKSELIETISEHKNNTDTIEYVVDLIMIAKYLERIGDHASNIAEWVIYSLTGSHPKLID